jgi:hypothetical protein
MQIRSFFKAKKIILLRRRTWKLLCLGTILAAFLLLIMKLDHKQDITYLRMEGMERIQISSTEYPYFIYLAQEPQFIVFKEKPLHFKAVTKVTELVPYDYYTYVFISEDRQLVRLHYCPTLDEIYSSDYHLTEASLGLKEMLLNLTALYRQEAGNTYGDLLVWDEVDRLFPIYAKARVTDIYTGQSFYVQRREGSSHVDAQPLTAEDTAVMKNIYGGLWSWERKGIIVEVGSQRIAASMHGMPHGGGKIDDNNFPGHFCIHFLGSTIHNGGMDIRHHREILKAAGKLPLDDVN